MRNQRGKNNPFYGKKHSKEVLEKMSESRKGKKNSNYKGLGASSVTVMGKKKWAEYAKKRYTIRFEKKTGRPKSEQCEICGSMGVICFDHNHQNDKFRGWICRRCNTVLGMVNDNVELLLKLVEYITKNK